MSIRRAAGGTDQLEVEIVTQATVSHQQAVDIDGQPFTLSSPAWRITREDSETVVASREPSAVRSLIKRLRNAQSIVVGGEKIIGLNGLTAALLRIDERQGLVGTQAALLRPGPRPASTVKPAPPIPHVPYRRIATTIGAQEAQRIEASLRQKMEVSQRDYDCERDSLAEPFEVHGLTATDALVLVECIRGAYQTSSLAFMVQRQGRTVRQVQLPNPYLGAPEDMSYVSLFTNASFNPKTGELGRSAKGRGLADCGMSAAWIWNGREFILSEMAKQDECGGPYLGDWPVLYRSTH